jgi:hypothetical protein
LLANLIGQMNLDKKPLPRFWYFPGGEEAAVIMTGDDHANGGTAGQFDNFKAASPQDCSVADWECIRSTSYVYTGTPLSDAAAKAYQDEGFEVALHVDTGCNNFTPESLETDFTDQLAGWQAKYVSLNVPVTNRTHCIAWSDWATHPKVELAHGIRLDTNYYYWPGSWIQDRPGMFTGSGMPMRFADLDGKMIDAYQATTQMTDESGQEYPATINALLDKAVGPEGYYGAFTANMHTDQSNHAGANAIVASAKARGVPVVSARQMLDWLDGRNASSFENMSWSDNQLSFTVAAGSGARNLQAMVPTKSDTGTLTGITRGGSPVEFNKQTIKGVEYAMFPSGAGEYVASYGVDTTAPTISALDAEPGADGSATISWTTDEPSTSKVEYGTSPDALTPSANDPALTTSHSVNLTGLEPQTTYYYRVSSTDEANNTATEPASGQPPASFQTPAAGFTDTTTSDFEGGTPANTYVAQTDNGEVVLKPEVGAEFSGSSLPAGWTGTPWATGGTSAVADGKLTVDGALAGTTAPPLYGPGRSLEFVATYGAAPNQHAGFGTDFNEALWAIFSTRDTTNTLYARTNNNGAAANTEIPNSGSLIGSQHTYRIEWASDSVKFYVDGNLVHTQNVAITAQMRPVISDLTPGSAAVAVDWLRMSPYASAGTFTSRVIDSTKSATDWLKLTQKPAVGTDVSFETRSGKTANAEDGSWSSWQAVDTDGTIASPDGQYVQYRASLSTTDPSISPAIEEVTLTYRLDEEIPAAPAKPDLADDSDSGGNKTDNLTNVTTPIFTGTAEAGSTVEIFADDSASLGTTDADQGGNWSFKVPDDKALSDGTHSITAKATDKAGNVSPASEALLVTVDTAAPETVVQLEATGSEDSIALDWADSSDSRLAGYNVYRAGSPTGTSPSSTTPC